MRIFVLGDAADVRGFALAGVEGGVAEDAETARALLEKTGDGHPVGLLLLSQRIARLLPGEVARLLPGEVARLLPGEVARLLRSERPPAVLVLPGPRA